MALAGGYPPSVRGKPPERVAAVIPAKDEAARIAATVQAASRIAHVDLVIVVDDGSGDATADLARSAGATVIRHPRNRGKAAAMESGAAEAERQDGDGPGDLPRALLFIDADLEQSALQTAALAAPVLSGEADLTVAVLPPQRESGGGHGFVVRLARNGIRKATGFVAAQPLSGMRCITREAFEAARPLAHGWGVEVGLTIDVLRGGYRLVEVPCELHHRVTGRDLRSQLHRAAQYRDVARALAARRIRARH